MRSTHAFTCAWLLLTLSLPHTRTLPLQDCDYIRRADILAPLLPWVKLPQLNLLHPIQKYLPAPPALPHSVNACMAAAPPASQAYAAAVTSGLAKLLQRARSPTAWEPFPFSDRYYYVKKWGGGVNMCGKGAFDAPFGGALGGGGLGSWVFDPAMRAGTVKGSELEGLLAPLV